MNNSKKSINYDRRWNNIYFLFGVYSLTCIIVFTINTLIPASSPRKFMEDKFIHKLNFTGVADYLNKKCKDNKSANSFPSGHVAETICISFAYLGMGKTAQGLLLLFFSLMISLATLFLRYHYFCDLAIAIFIAYFSYLINYHFGYKKSLKYMNINNESDVHIKSSKDIRHEDEKQDDKNFADFVEEV